MLREECGVVELCEECEVSDVEVQGGATGCPSRHSLSGESASLRGGVGTPTV